MPANRIAIKTFCTLEGTAFSEVQKAALAGEQVFVVYPLIEESDKEGKRSTSVSRAAKQEFEVLKQKFPHLKLGLIHGQLKSEEKRQVMASFRKGEFSVLVSTTVIEV